MSVTLRGQTPPAGPPTNPTEASVTAPGEPPPTRTARGRRLKTVARIEPY
jgi:hypothetical protein